MAGARVFIEKRVRALCRPVAETVIVPVTSNSSDPTDMDQIQTFFERMNETCDRISRDQVHNNEFY